MTVRQLAGHLAGIRHYRRGEVDSVGHRHYDDVVDALDLFAGDALLFRPGTDYRYSSFGYNLLSAVVQGAAGEPFTRYLERRILDPAGMQNTTPAFVDSLIPHRAETYVQGDGGERLRAPRVDPSYKWGSGGHLSTAADPVRFGGALLDHSLLHSTTVRTLWAPLETDAGESTGYGLGWRTLETSGGRRVIYHGGNLPGARSHLVIVPAEGLVLAALANTGQGIAFNDEEVLPLTELFLDHHLDTGGADVDPSGRYLFRTQWDDQPAVGWLEIRRSGDDYVGTLSFPSRVGPVPIVLVRGSTAHLIAVKGSWMHLWLDVSGSAIRGRWRWGPYEEEITDVRRIEDAFRPGSRPGSVARRLATPGRRRTRAASSSSSTISGRTSDTSGSAARYGRNPRRRWSGHRRGPIALSRSNCTHRYKCVRHVRRPSGPGDHPEWEMR